MINTNVCNIITGRVTRDVGYFRGVSFISSRGGTAPANVKVMKAVGSLPRLGYGCDGVVITVNSPSIELSLLGGVRRRVDFEVATLMSPRTCISSSTRVVPNYVVRPVTIVRSVSVVSENYVISTKTIMGRTDVYYSNIRISYGTAITNSALIPTKAGVGDNRMCSEGSVSIGSFFFSSRM